MSAIARLLRAEGALSGSDNGRWPLAEALRPLGVVVNDRFAPEHVVGADVVIRSSAYGDENPEVAAARSAGIPVWRRHDAWAHLARRRLILAVAGTHGKTTTTAMAWTALRGGGRDASLICGAEVRELGANAHVGSGPELVIEADEYDRTFHALAPAIAIVTNVEHDHVDVYPTFADVAEAFREFAARILPGGALVACVDEPGARDLAGWARERLRGRADVVTYGTSPEADAWITDVRDQEDGLAFAVRYEGRSIPVALRLGGLHNARNATAALLAAHRWGVDPRAAADAIGAFAGTARRLEVLGRAAGVTVIDDYAHHPTEIRASIEATRPRARARLIVLFQPHTPSRLRAFFDGFADALALADVVLVAETFSSARERADAAGLARSLAERVGGIYVTDAAAAASELAARAGDGDVVLVLGAGDIRWAGERLLGMLAEAAPA